MTNYQKAIEVRKVCENREMCNDCGYYYDCKRSRILHFSPACENIETIVKAIKEEKWNVK